ncbi:hypothetical protein D5274_00620 [bacterium 1XD42-94]|nr:hypothetical protein [bacterium 1XD42-76]NBK03709.1 hypothetical protein [bacterium 1XD42-94]
MVFSIGIEYHIFLTKKRENWHFSQIFFDDYEIYFLILKFISYIIKKKQKHREIYHPVTDSLPVYIVEMG